MKNVYPWLALILLFVFCFTLFLGINKMTDYKYAENYPSLSRNAYVGSDAYNYIINAGYSTSYFVLSIGSFISMLLCLMGIHLIDIKELKESELRDMRMQKANHAESSPSAPTTPAA